MAVLVPQILDSGYLCFDRTAAVQAGLRFADCFAEGTPFPHVVIDDFLDRELLRRVITEFPVKPPREILETGSQHAKRNFLPEDIASGFIRNLLAEFTHNAILDFIQSVTGMQHLIADPWYTGAGLHETLQGGHLGIHADFSLSRQMRVQRRINLIVFLNDDWPESYGGHLEFWDRQGKTCVSRILPVMGRAVVFRTDLDAYHGHPQPLSCPAGRSRRSIAVYYYTAPEKGIASLPPRGAAFRSGARGVSGLGRDWRRLLANMAIDATPPIIYRTVRHLAGRG